MLLAEFTVAIKSQIGESRSGVGECRPVACECLIDDVDGAEPADARRCAGEVSVHRFLRNTNRFENLSAAITTEQRDTHFCDDLQNSLLDGPPVIHKGFFHGHTEYRSLSGNNAAYGFKREIWIDGIHAVSNQRREFVYIARL